MSYLYTVKPEPTEMSPLISPVQLRFLDLCSRNETKRFQQFNPWAQFYILGWRVEDNPKGLKILLEDEEITGL